MIKFTEYVDAKTWKPKKKIVEDIEPQQVIEETTESEEPIIENVELPLENVPKIVVISEKEQFDEMDLSGQELLEIKKLALKDIIETDLSLSELVDLVLLAKTGKKVKSKNVESLLIREYLDNSGKITKNGRMYLEFDDVKERLRTLIK